MSHFFSNTGIYQLSKEELDADYGYAWMVFDRFENNTFTFFGYAKGSIQIVATLTFKDTHKGYYYYHRRCIVQIQPNVYLLQERCFPKRTPLILA